MSFDPEQFRKQLLADAAKAASDVIAEGPPVIQTDADRPSYAETYSLALQRQRAIYGPKSDLEGLDDTAILALATEQARRNVAAQQHRVSEAQAATPEGVAAIADEKRKAATDRTSFLNDVVAAYDLPEGMTDDEIEGIWNSIQATAKEKAEDTVEANIAAAEATSKVSD